jgi:hypothetical protein
MHFKQVIPKLSNVMAVLTGKIWVITVSMGGLRSFAWQVDMQVF